MIKKIFKLIFKTSVPEKKIIFKEIFFSDSNENITRIIKLIKKTEVVFDNNDIILDIGAYNGDTSKLFSRAFPEIKIMAFEANPKMYQSALNNCIPNSNITLYNAAISDREEILNFYVTSNDVSSSLNAINNKEVHAEEYKVALNVKNELRVQAKKLDTYTEGKNILLLKIDTQGHELKVIDGAKKTLQNTKFVLIEMANHNMYVNGCRYYEVDELMRQSNFSLVDIIVTYRKKGIIMYEYDAIYVNNKCKIE